MTCTFLCDYNNTKELKEMLLCSLSRIDSRVCDLDPAGAYTLREFNDFSVLLIDGSKCGCKSAASAYNEATRKFCDRLGDVLCFVHQDIFFMSADVVQRIERYFFDNELQLLGLAGINDAGVVLSNLKYKSDDQYITKNQLTVKSPCVSLDECCIFVKKSLFLDVRFDEITCAHWHLYAVDLCLSAFCKLKAQSFVLPDIECYHKQVPGGLSVDRDFLDTMYKLSRKYRADFRKIYAPCYVCPTFFPLAWLRIFRSRIKNFFNCFAKC